MNRFYLISALFLAVFALALGLVAFPPPAAAAPPECPDGYMTMMAGEHHGDGEHEHMDHLHVGVWPDTDINGDGTICVKHLTRGGQNIHVHIDNIAR